MPASAAPPRSKAKTTTASQRTQSARLKAAKASSIRASDRLPSTAAAMCPFTFRFGSYEPAPAVRGEPGDPLVDSPGPAGTGQPSRMRRPSGGPSTMADSRERWALILGASSGMGEATARALAADGYNITGIHLDFRAALQHV